MYDFNALYEANTLQEALELKATYPHALLLAGGSDILIKLRDGKYTGCDLISIYTLDELRGVELLDDGTIVIKPLTSFTDVAQNPILLKYVPTLCEAVEQIGAPQVRNIGTIGGNICNGVTSADSATTLKAYDAMLVIESQKGKRILPYLEFNLGPGKVDLKEDEILTAITISKESYNATYGHYIKYAKRKAMDIATLGCSVNVTLSGDKSKIERLRIAFGVAAPIPVRGINTEKETQGHPVNAELLNLIRERVLDDVTPRDSWRASKEFRLHLIQELAVRATREAIIKGGGSIDD
ncbi:MAG: xanthine dehydrogenase subunit XdhB [Sphaerochaetaceae bacterium]|jgi:xanthine dehydrogenase FAD-binding subunit|nr:xanthine dehydrogenase FAD-binding subunit XdhB [Sphaerochaetaceae bacterium]HHU88033.1 xanthine dehydrogenase FAD-binding subunit XdhB [Spirochaetales bacterium]